MVLLYLVKVIEINKPLININVKRNNFRKEIQTFNWFFGDVSKKHVIKTNFRYLILSSAAAEELFLNCLRRKQDKRLRPDGWNPKSLSKR